MKQEGLLLGPEDRVIVTECWKFPVPTGHEVKLLLDTFEEGSAIHTALYTIAVEGLRPIEITRLRWPWFKIDTDGKIVQFRHRVNKPVGRVTRGGINYVEKELIKPVHALSPRLHDALTLYAKTAPKLTCDLVFPWSQAGCISKHLSMLRKWVKKYPKKYGPEYACLFDKNAYITAGPDQPIPYRINLYSLRRFCITFHFYTTFRMDPIATAKFFGHSEAATTLGHYVMPKEAIGLTQEMIDDGITIDQFIHLQGKKQMRLIEFDPHWDKRFTPVGQLQLHDFDDSEIELDF